MSQAQEVIEFSIGGGDEAAKLKVPILRGPSNEIYLALQPPEAHPYVVAPQAVPADEVAKFVAERLGVVQELQTDMLKHFSKTKSLKCHFKTGDVAHLFGRPFMLRVNPLSSGKKSRKPTRGLASLSARLYNDLSLIELFVSHVGNYEQGRTAFMSYAQPIFARNVVSLLKESMARVFPESPLPAQVKCRPMRDSWIKLDEAHDGVWFSESLIPYPSHAVVYVYLVEAIKRFAPEADEAKREQLLARGVPNWKDMKALLSDPKNKYAL